MEPVVEANPVLSPVESSYSRADYLETQTFSAKCQQYKNEALHALGSAVYSGQNPNDLRQEREQEQKEAVQKQATAIDVSAVSSYAAEQNAMPIATGGDALNFEFSSTVVSPQEATAIVAENFADKIGAFDR